MEDNQELVEDEDDISIDTSVLSLIGLDSLGDKHNLSTLLFQESLRSTMPLHDSTETSGHWIFFGDSLAHCSQFYFYARVHFRYLINT